MIHLGVEHQYIGISMGLMAASRGIGGAVATIIYVVILQDNLKAPLGIMVATALAKAGLTPAQIPAVAEAIATGDVIGPALKTVSLVVIEAGAYAVKEFYAHTFREVYLVSIVFGVLGTTCATFSLNVDHLMTGKVDIALEEGAHVKSHADNSGGHIIRHGDTH